MSEMQICYDHKGLPVTYHEIYGECPVCEQYKNIPVETQIMSMLILKVEAEIHNMTQREFLELANSMFGDTAEIRELREILDSKK